MRVRLFLLYLDLWHPQRAQRVQGGAVGGDHARNHVGAVKVAARERNQRDGACNHMGGGR